MKVATLKSRAKRPDLIEGINIYFNNPNLGWDITSPCPLSLAFLKAYKNTV